MSTGVYDSAKILIWKQITTSTFVIVTSCWCIWLCKDTNLKANHNYWFYFRWFSSGVYDSAKILIWKQITTASMISYLASGCIWLCKDTNLKANHNREGAQASALAGVYDSAKILIWKQITTIRKTFDECLGCIWLCKDTNLKANHNRIKTPKFDLSGVYDSAKILIWKQITTSLDASFDDIKVYMTLQRY